MQFWPQNIITDSHCKSVTCTYFIHMLNEIWCSHSIKQKHYDLPDCVAPCNSAQVTTHILQNLLPATCSSETVERKHHTAWVTFEKATGYSCMNIPHICNSNSWASFLRQTWQEWKGLLQYVIKIIFQIHFLWFCCWFVSNGANQWNRI